MRLLTILMVCLFGSTVLAQRSERAERATPPRGEARIAQMREQLHELREQLRELRQSAHELRRPARQQAERLAPPQRGPAGAKGRRGGRAGTEGGPQSRGQQPRRQIAAPRGRGGEERARHGGAPFQRRHAQPMPIRMRMQMLRQRAEALREAAQRRGGDERRHATPGRKGGRSSGVERGAEPRPRHRSVIR